MSEPASKLPAAPVKGAPGNKPPANPASKTSASKTPATVVSGAPLFKLKLVKGRADQDAAIIKDFQSDTAEIVNGPDPLPARLTLFFLLAGLIIGLIWASVAYIDRVVSARGAIVATQPAILIQPFDTAIVRSIAVREGDVVKAGAVLATLDPTFSAADVAQLELRLASVDANIERLRAEVERKPYMLPAQANDAQLLQYDLWRQRQQEFLARQRYYDEVSARLKEARAAKQRDIGHLREQQALVDEIEEMRRKLAQAELGSRLNLLMAQRESNNLTRSLASISSELEQIGHQLEASEAERDIYLKQWNNQIAADMVRLSDERNGLMEQLNKARRRLALVDMKTPEDAVVLEVASRSVGSIVQSGAVLIRLVPLNSPLEVEAFIAAKDIGNVQVGDKVNLKLDAYPFIEHGMIEGEVAVISEDAFSDPRALSAGATYKTRIKLGKRNLRGLPEYFRLIPGTPLTADIKVGTRSVLAYFLRPITRGLEEGLREP